MLVYALPRHCSISDSSRIETSLDKFVMLSQVISFYPRLIVC